MYVIHFSAKPPYHSDRSDALNVVEEVLDARTATVSDVRALAYSAGIIGHWLSKQLCTGKVIWIFKSRAKSVWKKLTTFFKQSAI